MAPLKARLWGNVTLAGITVKVQVNGVGAHEGWATAAADGSWSIDLDPRAASADNRVEVVPSSGSPIVLTNVAFGDVFLCEPTPLQPHTLANNIRTYISVLPS
jgi:hypothetical protein